MKLKYAAAVAIAGALLLGLTGCGPDHGTVHNKSHTEGYYYSTSICSGKPVVCTPILNYQAPTWSLDVYASEDEHGWVGVTESTYNSYNVGDFIDFREDKGVK